MTEHAAVDKVISVLTYIIAGFMLLAGVLTPFAKLQPMDGALGYIYNTRISLVCFGIVFFASGAALLYGKIRKNKTWTGNGLLAVFACFTFSAVLETVARNTPSIGNIIAAIILAILYLRWRFTTVYVKPEELQDKIDEITRR
jgi:hypothetical protein